MVTGDGRVSSDQVGLVGVVAQIGTDERAEGDELEPTGAEVLQALATSRSPSPRPAKAGSISVWTSWTVPGSARYWMNPAWVVPSQSS
jgi:hypothetical protein